MPRRRASVPVPEMKPIARAPQVIDPRCRAQWDRRWSWLNDPPGQFLEPRKLFGLILGIFLDVLVENFLRQRSRFGIFGFKSFDGLFRKIAAALVEPIGYNPLQIPGAIAGHVSGKCGKVKLNSAIILHNPNSLRV